MNYLPERRSSNGVERISIIDLAQVAGHQYTIYYVKHMALRLEAAGNLLKVEIGAEIVALLNLFRDR